MRKLITLAVMSVMAASLFAGTASAAPGTADVFVAHGIPGVKVDVCVNDSEVRSNFRYGRRFLLNDVPAGNYTVRVFLADDRECAGTLVIRRDLSLVGGMNATAVAKLFAGTPGLKIFLNDTTVTEGAGGVTIRHAAKAPPVDVWVNGGESPLLTNFQEGNSAGPVSIPASTVVAYWAALAGTYTPVIGPGVAQIADGTSYQIIAVGTSVENYRFIVIAQPGTVTT